MDKFVFFSILGFGYIYILSFWSSNKTNYLLQFIFVLFIGLFFGFRSESSGSDTGTYLRYFQSILDLNIQHNFEYGFTQFSTALVSILSKDIYLVVIVLIQLLFLYFSFISIKLRNTLACIWLFIAFMPGLDLISSAIRSFMAASVGAFIFCSTINRPKLKIFNLVPVIFHFSYALIFLISIIPVKKTSVKLINAIYCWSVFNFLFLLVFDVRFFASILNDFTSGYGILSKLVRYIVLENDLLSPLVRFYFSFLTIVLSSVLIYLLNKQKKDNDIDEVFFNLVFLSILAQFFFSIVSFTDFAYRFYYVYYTLQIIGVVYGLSLLANKKLGFFIYSGLLFFGFITTYATNKFSNYGFFDQLF